jgi:DNA-binding beta-propeller fold protein YncE
MRVFTLILLAACTSSSDPEPIPDVGPTDPPFMAGVSTLAGAAESGVVDGDRSVTLFHNPVNVALGPDGKLYTADFDNHRLRVTDMTGATSTVIFEPGFARPFGLAFGSGVLFVQTDNDAANGHSPMTGTIWRVDVAARTADVVVQGIGRPRGLAVLADGRIAMADYVHHVVQLLDPATGAITPLAGAWDSQGFVDGIGADARFASPYGIVQRADGSLVVCDFDNHRLRTIGLDGTVGTLTGDAAGFTDGSLASARFNHPQGLAISASGDLYVTDLGNARVRRISHGSVETIAGDGTAGYRDHDDPLLAELYGLEGISVSPDGSRVFVADGTRGEDVPFNRVRMILRDL